MKYACPNVECSCPDYWFPKNKRNVLQKIPHNFQGLAYHSECPMNTDAQKRKNNNLKEILQEASEKVNSLPESRHSDIYRSEIKHVEMLLHTTTFSYKSESEILEMIHDMRKEEFLSLCIQLQAKFKSSSLEEIILHQSSDEFLTNLILQLKEWCESN